MSDREPFQNAPHHEYWGWVERRAAPLEQNANAARAVLARLSGTDGLTPAVVGDCDDCAATTSRFEYGPRLRLCRHCATRRARASTAFSGRDALDESPDATAGG